MNIAARYPSRVRNVMRGTRWDGIMTDPGAEREPKKIEGYSYGNPFSAGIE
jgi:hypothetical protein